MLDYNAWVEREAKAWGDELRAEQRARFEPGYQPTTPTIKEQTDEREEPAPATAGDHL